MCIYIYCWSLSKSLPWSGCICVYSRSENNCSLIHVFFSFSESVEIREGDEILNKTRFEPTRRMSTYLLAFIVSDFKAIGKMEDDVLVIEFF